MTKREGRFLILFAWALTLAVPAAKAEPQLSSKVSSTAVYLDEKVLLTLEADWPQENANYSFILPVPAVKNLVLKRQGESQETYQKGDALWARKSLTFEFQPENAGPAVIESFSLQYVEPETGTPGSLQVPAYTLNVRKRGLPTGVKFAGAGAGALLAAACIFMALRRRGASAPKRSGPELSMEERVSQALRQLPAVSSQDEALTKGGVVFQSYLAEKFALASISFDMDQLNRRLEEKSVEALEVKRARKLVEKFREARYSGVPLTSSEVQEILEEAAAWVDRRKIVGAGA